MEWVLRLAGGSAGPRLAQQGKPGTSERAQGTQKDHETTLPTARVFLYLSFHNPVHEGPLSFHPVSPEVDNDNGCTTDLQSREGVCTHLPTTMCLFPA